MPFRETNCLLVTCNVLVFVFLYIIFSVFLNKSTSYPYIQLLIIKTFQFRYISYPSMIKKMRKECNRRIFNLIFF